MQREMISTYTLSMTTQPVPEANMVPHRSGGKRTSEELGELERATPNKRLRGERHISWAENQNETHLLPNNSKLFKEYRDENIWFTRNDYKSFLVDRLRTIKCLRDSKGDESALDQESYCARGLEVFETPEGHQQFSSERSFHRSTVLIEQVRQSMYGMRSPERFRMMVGPQSEMAARRARELAAVDEHAVCGRVRTRRGSLYSTPTSNCPSIQQKALTGDGKTNSSDASSLSLDERIRQLQESNARRLMEIYSQPGYNPFRFPIRRDSLIGSNSMVGGTFDISNRFPIRRDSLTPSGSMGHL